jgi:hypothetical protein
LNQQLRIFQGHRKSDPVSSLDPKGGIPSDEDSDSVLSIGDRGQPHKVRVLYVGILFDANMLSIPMTGPVQMIAQGRISRAGCRVFQIPKRRRKNPRTQLVCGIRHVAAEQRNHIELMTLAET